MFYNAVTYPDFLGRAVDTLNPQRCHNGWGIAAKFSKFVPPDIQICAPWPCLFLDFFESYQ